MLGLDDVRSTLADDDGRGVGVAGRHVGHDRGVDDAEGLELADLAGEVDDSVGVAVGALGGGGKGSSVSRWQDARQRLRLTMRQVVVGWYTVMMVF